MKVFNYFFSFAHSKGFGNCCVGFREPIETFDQIKDVEKLISSEDPSTRAITILYYQLLSEELVDEE